MQTDKPHARPERLLIVVNVEKNVFLVKDKETVRTKEIILFEYVSWVDPLDARTFIPTAHNQGSVTHTVRQEDAHQQRGALALGHRLG